VTSPVPPPSLVIPAKAGIHGRTGLNGTRGTQRGDDRKRQGWRGARYWARRVTRTGRRGKARMAKAGS
jgi:hypothetical protein